MKTFHKLMIAGFFCASAALPVAAHASGTADQATAPDIKMAAAAGDMSDGEIRKHDSECRSSVFQ